MRFQHIIEQVYFRPWYITPTGHAAIHAVLRSRLGIFMAEDEPVASGGPRAGLFDDMFVQRKPLSIDRDGIATIQVLGPLGQGLSKMEKTCGCTDFADIQADFREAVDKGARGILLDINSPGGTVSGTPETADVIAGKPIPVVAYAGELMASAAYYLGAGADAIVASKSSLVGSIGVYIPWVDRSRMYEDMGLKPDPIVNTGGDLKALGFGGRLTDAQREHLQDAVDKDFSAFREHVRAFRAVPDTAMRGQVLKGNEAHEAALIDEIGDLAAARTRLKALMKQKF
jgi:signal peptide peptidase SppA